MENHSEVDYVFVCFYLPTGYGGYARNLFLYIHPGRRIYLYIIGEENILTSNVPSDESQETQGEQKKSQSPPETQPIRHSGQGNKQQAQ